MQPLRLCLNNFCGHLKTEFSFDDFSSALIVGKVKDNERFSNGAGKSTIFNAIEYVLFNEVHFSALEKVIRDGCDICCVEFDFLSSIDKSVYRITRSNSRKTGTDVRFYKKIDDKKWEDLTQRRVSDTEKEIIKIVGFNYKAFCASVLFSQSGSENNIQKDYGNLPYLTPEKRKSVLREVLQLNVYTNYEKLAKNKLNSIHASLEKQRVLLSAIGEVEDKINFIKKEKKSISNEILIQNELIKKEEINFDSLNDEYSFLVEKNNVVKNKISSLKSKESVIQENIKKTRITILDLKSKLCNLPAEANKIKSDIEIKNANLSLLKNKTIDQKILQDILNEIISDTIEISSRYTSITDKISECEKPFTEDKICNNCHQIISDEHKHNWNDLNKKEIITLKSEKDKLDEKLKILSDRRRDIDAKIAEAVENDKRILSENALINSMNKDVEYKRTLHNHYSMLLAEHTAVEKNNSQELENILEQIKTESLQVNDKDTVRIEELKSFISKSKNNLSNLSAIKNKLSNQLAVINHQLEVLEENKKKSQELKNYISELEKSLLLNSKVVQAFGSNGIPSLITHSILDDLQEEANKWLLKLRPGLQLQFIVINDKNNKEKEDTLDILYFIDGNQREYKQLSGAQKIIVSLSIKLSLLFIMNKRLGIDIKLILLDEVDQALDPGSTEIFADIIRIIQEDFKVMVITHDDEIKHKFSHAIVVEQDENNVSHGKLVSW